MGPKSKVEGRCKEIKVAIWDKCSQNEVRTTIKIGLNGVEVAPFGVSLGRNGVPGGAEPLGLLPRAILVLFFFPPGVSALGPRGLGPRAPGRCAAGRRCSAVYTGRLNTDR